MKNTEEKGNADNYVRSINKNKIHILRNNIWQKSNQEYLT